MDTFDEITAAVEERVREQLPARVLHALTRTHAKREFRRGCDCEYCRIKRRATADIGHMRQILWAGLPLVERKWSGDERPYAIEIIRDSLRQKYREMLKEAESH